MGVSLDTSLPLAPLTAATVASGVNASWLEPDPSAEAVLATYDSGYSIARMSPDTPPERIALDGARTPYAMHSEGGGYADVGLAPGGRVLAPDVSRGTSCSGGGGPFTYSTGSGGGCAVNWTQLVLHQLGGGAPVELAHADYSGGGGAEVVVAVEQPDGTYVSVTEDGWYRRP